MTATLFANAAEVLSAMAVVRKHLAEEWISEGCRLEQDFGCISCRALRLDQELALLQYELEVDLKSAEKST
jgi:hypothetical protein